MIRWFPAGVLAVALACAVGRPALAAWPDDRPIEIIVGFQAGSGPDILARRIAPVLARLLGPKAGFVVNNRTGAAGEIALTALSRAEPNGYTIGGLSTPSFIVVPLIKKPQYDPAATCRWRGWWTIRPWWWRAARAGSRTSRSWSRG